MAYRLLVSSYTDAIYTISFNAEAGSVDLVSTTRVGHHPSWVTSHPDDASLVFTGLEQSEGVVLAVKFDDKGEGKVVGRVSSGGADPCSLLATKDELLVANYSTGSITTIPISSEQPYFLAKSSKTVSFTGSGPNADRQEAPHAHQVYLHPDTNELLVPDLGSDKVWRFTKGDDGSWSIRDHISYKAGDGPRHVALYALELSNSVAKHQLHSLPLSAAYVASAPTLSQPTPSPDMLVAEILIPPPNASYPTPYVYVSNRNDPSPEGDTIAIFTTDLELVAEVRTGLNHVRGMMFGGPDDKWLIAGGAIGGGITVFERVDGGKGLKKIARNPNVDKPTGFLWI
ncbi:hypothetical protein PLEOSDRAFT_167761 [Pleurotus ostreatus PC15]|uniref:Isomerase YbhE n=1 Tax=Pleurotus ostreatus (strain PC15) TaxID=1137138 RepID=A0A067NKJ8_PLEO1|nr:hypothetical protein PLEOSDRAFT_167761 [Pleurotus ostreatus PC15]